MENKENSPITTHLAQRAGQGASSELISAAVAAAWQEIDDSLSPILGNGGVAALYGRSLYLTSPSYPCLGIDNSGGVTDMDLVTLKLVLAQQGSADAAAAGGALLQTFHTLLTSMVGPTLTEQLLSAPWENLLSGRPAQDKTP